MKTSAPKRTGPTRSKGRSDAQEFLIELGSKARRLRARSGLTRKELAQEAGVSERHLANFEMGIGNPSVLILRQLSRALNRTAADLIDLSEESADWLLIRDLLRGRSAAELAELRQMLTDRFGLVGTAESRRGRIALIGLRGAGKSTLGKMLANNLKVPFVEVNRVVERLAGCSAEEVHGLYGANAYRRYERQALEEVLAHHSRAVIATPGGLVSEAATFNLLLQGCFTIWIKAAPEEHMNRVLAQGDTRPMAGIQQAMDDLHLILAERSPFYAKADATCDTTGKSLAASFELLLRCVGPAETATAMQ